MTIPVSFDGVSKMSGVWASAGSEANRTVCWVAVKENATAVTLSVPDYHVAHMNVSEARSLAAQLMEAARRHEVRKDMSK